MIASRLGHTSVRTVLDVYGHLFEGLDRDIADSLDAPSDAPAAYFLPTCDVRHMLDEAVFSVEDFDVELMVTGEQLMSNMSLYTVASGWFSAVLSVR